MIEVLFVDDELDLLQLAKTKFEKEMEGETVSVSLASSAQQCLDFLDLKKDITKILVISDINMPEMDGLALLRVIQKRHPQVKVYICTAFDTPFFRKNTEDKGALRFFVKPLNFSNLRTALIEDFALQAPLRDPAT